MNDSDLSVRVLLEPGDYDFEVKKAEAKNSAKGNEMISLYLSVWNHDGLSTLVFDHLINIESMEWKTRHFADAVGLRESYDSGEIYPEDCVGLSGVVRIGIENESKDNTSGKIYPKKNIAEDYVSSNATLPQSVPANQEATKTGDATLLTKKEAIAECIKNDITPKMMATHLSAAGISQWDDATCTPLIRQLIRVEKAAKASDAAASGQADTSGLDDDIPF